MQNDTEPQARDDSEDITQASPVRPQPRVGGQRVIQPTPEFLRDVQAQQAAQPPDTQPPQQPIQAQPVHQSTPAASDQMPVGAAASQLGVQHSKGGFNVKSLFVKGLITVLVIGGICAILIATNIIALSQFKTIEYINSKGGRYSLQFYTKHTTRTLSSGNKQLISKVSEAGKFPITLSIATATGATSAYDRAKDCAGFTKVFAVQNDNLNQKISVCNFSTSQATPGGVYIAGILYNNQTSIITIGQDLSGVNLSSQSGARQSLAKFGLDPYQDDIQKIIASIKIE